jgi:putative addiction module component (TIGR02574 family)
MSVDAILKEVEGLSAGERAELIGQLLDRYGDPAPAVEISDELKAELERRDAAYEADPTNVYTWEQVVEYVRQKR